MQTVLKTENYISEDKIYLSIPKLKFTRSSGNAEWYDFSLSLISKFSSESTKGDFKLKSLKEATGKKTPHLNLFN